MGGWVGRRGGVACHVALWCIAVWCGVTCWAAAPFGAACTSCLQMPAMGREMLYAAGYLGLFAAASGRITPSFALVCLCAALGGE